MGMEKQWKGEGHRNGEGNGRGRIMEVEKQWKRTGNGGGKAMEGETAVGGKERTSLLVLTKKKKHPL